MIIIQVAGGLGNQLQQYALYQKFLSLGVEARLDLSWFYTETQQSISVPRELELGYFDQLEYQPCTTAEKKNLYGGSDLLGKVRRRFLPYTVRLFQESEMYHPEIFDVTNRYIIGYFACEKYYHDILPKLREQIRFKPSKNPRNVQMAEEMRNCDSIAVHIRRGDYLSSGNRELYGGICTKDYYERAIDYISQRHPQAQFYFFSDDPDYVRSEYTKKDATIIDWNYGDDNIYDMYLMSVCKHIICANSTFSFWGARLNKNEGKIMIRPLRHRNNLIADPERMKSLWPGWTLIDREGKMYG